MVYTLPPRHLGRHQPTKNADTQKPQRRAKYCSNYHEVLLSYQEKLLNAKTSTASSY
jgi:hypothetical protein